MKTSQRIRRKLLSHGFLHTRKSPQPFRWGVIGTGHMANTLCTEIAAKQSSVISAVASRDASRAHKFAKRYRCPLSYGSYESLILSANVDVIYVATPLEDHYDTVRNCLVHGHNVLCEKPITETSREFDELVEIAEKNKCFLMEAMWSALLPTMTFAREAIARGELGKIKLVKIDLNKMTKKAETASGRDKQRIMRDFGVYPLAFLISLLGSRDISTIKVEATEVDGWSEHWNIRLRVAEVICDISMSNNYCGSSAAAVIGDLASIQWDSPFNRTNRVRVFSRSGVEQRCESFRYQFEGYEFQIDEVVEAVRSGYQCSPIYDWDSIRSALALIEELTGNNA